MFFEEKSLCTTEVSCKSLKTLQHTGTSFWTMFFCNSAVTNSVVPLYTVVVSSHSQPTGSLLNHTELVSWTRVLESFVTSENSSSECLSPAFTCTQGSAHFLSFSMGKKVTSQWCFFSRFHIRGRIRRNLSGCIIKAEALDRKQFARKKRPPYPCL